MHNIMSDRLVMDQPCSNTEAALNLFYIKNGETWVRGGGPAPDFPDITLLDYIRYIAKLHSLFISQETSNEELGDELFELLLDGPGTAEGIVATLYAAAWAFSCLREKLKAYEDTGLTPEEIKTSLTDATDLAKVAMALRKLRKYEDADADDRLLVLPCKLGTQIFDLDGKGLIYDTFVERFELNEEDGLLIEISDGMAFTPDEIGKSVFYSFDEAEAAAAAAGLTAKLFDGEEED